MYMWDMRSIIGLLKMVSTLIKTRFMKGSTIMESKKVMEN